MVPSVFLGASKPKLRSLHHLPSRLCPAGQFLVVPGTNKPWSFVVGFLGPGPDTSATILCFWVVFGELGARGVVEFPLPVFVWNYSDACPYRHVFMPSLFIWA
jgi:hypothetical protein